MTPPRLPLVAPDSAHISGLSLLKPTSLAADFVVVGSGAAGAAAAARLTELGADVLVLEEGPWVRTEDVKLDVASAFAEVARESGLQVLEGRAFLPMLQGVCVGGSTFINSAIAWRTPEDVLDDWSKRFGLGDAWSMSRLDGAFEALERDLSVREVEDAVLGENSRLFLDAARARGIDAHRMRRYERGCRGSSRCAQGCPHGAKQSMTVSYIPQALAGGARLVSSCRVDRVVLRGGRAVGAHATTRGGAPLTVHARRAVVVAASTVQTPNLLARSGVRHRALGRHFQAHPGIGLAGLFDAPVGMSRGATQGAESTHFRVSDRFKLETISLPPDLAAARIPGSGAELTERLASLDHVAIWAAQVRSDAEGTVTSGWAGRDVVRFTMSDGDMRASRRAMTLLAEMMFEAGAREVWPGLVGVPAVLRSIDDVRQIAECSLDPRAWSFITTHLFGAARMGVDARVSVVSPELEVFGVRGLYVVDSSVFPTNLGVNPQHSIMAIARSAAERMRDGAPREA